jgi:hypothetical protein
VPCRALRLTAVAAITIAVISAAPALTQAAPASADQGPARQGAQARDARPTASRVLPHAAHGVKALAALGSNLPAVAVRNGWSTAKLRSVLSTDRTAYVSSDGDVFYQEDEPEQSTTSGATSAVKTIAPVLPTSQTFTLHSRPSATRKIFLDFDGATVSNTGWNGTGAGKVANGAHTGFNLDGSPSTFSIAEQGYIQEVWREVSETYSPFDVDVTTQDPGVAGIVRSSSSDTSFGTHVVITSEAAPRTALCGGTCLGLAWVGTFDNVDANGYYQPAWVFDYSAGFDPMIIAQAAAHETGHTLGLSHDGTTTAPYYGGTAAWGPIMGSSMNRAVSQFSKGEYTGANNTQDDLAIIASNGLPLRGDDFVSTDALGAKSSYSAKGVISTRADSDSFSISLPCTTPLTVTANGIGAQSALDIMLTVSNGAGQVVKTSSPVSGHTGSIPVSTGMGASVTIPNASGTYVLRVEGVGNGSPASGGWSDYASLGQYTLTASGCPTASAISGTTGQSPSVTPTVAPVRHHVPSAPRVGSVTSGAPRGPVTANVRWYAPASTGGTPVTSYRLQALRLDSHQRVVHTITSGKISSNVRGVSVRLAKGRYRFRLVAINAVGTSTWSSTSRIVQAR